MSQTTDTPSWSAPKTEFEELLDSSFVRDTTTPDSVSHSKADRMLRLTTTDLFFKGIRPDFDKRDLDFLCDLVCANLGRHLDLPVLPQYPVEHPKYGLGLVSPHLKGETGIAVDDHSQLANGDKVPQLCVFEEWVMNTDDKAEHFRTVGREGEKRVYAFDHGHTLHQANSFDGQVETNDRIRQSVGQNPYNYGSPSKVTSGVELIQGTTDEETRRVVRKSLDQIRRASPDDPDIESLVEDADTHTTTVVNILRERRRNIDQIIKSKFQ